MLHVVERMEGERQVLALVVDPFQLLDVALEQRHLRLLALGQPPPERDLLVRQVDAGDLRPLLRQHDAVLPAAAAEDDRVQAGDIAYQVELLLVRAARPVDELVRRELVALLVCLGDGVPGLSIVGRGAAGGQRHGAGGRGCLAFASEPVAQRRRRLCVRQLLFAQPASVRVVAFGAKAQIAAVAEHAKDVGDVAPMRRFVVEGERLDEHVLFDLDAQLPDGVALQRLLRRLLAFDDHAGQEPASGEGRLVLLAADHEGAPLSFEQRQREYIGHG